MTVVFVYAAAVGVAVVGVRISLLFPAVAVDAPSDSLLNRAQTSWKQTSGHFWYIFWIAVVIGFVISVPLGVILGIFTIWKIISQTLANGGPSDPNIMVRLMTAGPFLALSALQYVVITAAAAAGLSWIYRALVEKSVGSTTQR
jgi:uncharacterized protein YneF (UPF0154 family)